MIYKVNFYRLNIAARDWLQFVKMLLSAVWFFRIAVLRCGRQVDFYVITKKEIDILNSRAFPFYLSDDIKEEEEVLLRDEEVKSSLLPMFLQFNLLRTFEKKALRGKDIYRIDFRISKFNPLRLFPFMRVRYYAAGEKYGAGSLVPRRLDSFLAFDLSSTISAEVTKVKPQLVSSDLKFVLQEEGVLDIKKMGGRGRFSVASYDFNRHSLVVGQSGSGKSTFLKLLIEDLRQKTGDDFCVVLIDPHAALSEQVADSVGGRIIDFKNISTNLFININQPALSTELTLDLFGTVLNVRENQELHRVLKYALNFLYSIDAMSLENLHNVLTDTLQRKELLKRTENRNILQFFETEYREIYTGKYVTAVLPILNLIAELDFVNDAKATADLVDEMNANFLVSFPIQQVTLGKTIARIVGASLIQQVFTIAQAGLVGKKIVLVIDEVSVMQTPALIHILSEARKFDLTIIFSQQYLMQVSLDILQSVFANVVNYFSFKVSRDDAEMLARNLGLQIDDLFFSNKNDPRENQELGAKVLTDLNPREVVARVLVNDHYYSPFKAKTININNKQYE